MIVKPIEDFLTDENRETYYTIAETFKGAIIAGGSARQIFLGEKFGSTDIDIYFPSYEVLRQNNIYRTVFAKVTSKSLTFNVNNLTIQIIKGKFLIPEAIFNTYDFTCCCFAIKDNLLYYTKEAEEHALKKRMVFTDQDISNHNHPYQRVRKYLDKGYVPSCDLSLQLFENFLLWWIENQKNKEQEDTSWLFINFKDATIKEIYDAYFGSLEDMEY